MFEMDHRNLRALILLSVFIVIVVVINFLIIPYFDGIKSFKREINQKKKHIDEMLDLEKKVKLYKYRNKNPKKLQAGNDFSLYSYLYKLAGKHGIKENINYIKPSTLKNKKRGINGTLVEIEFKNISLKKFTNLLYEAEYSDHGLNVTKMSITKSGTLNKSLNIIMHVEYIKV